MNTLKLWYFKKYKPQNLIKIIEVKNNKYITTSYYDKNDNYVKGILINKEAIYYDSKKIATIVMNCDNAENLNLFTQKPAYNRDEYKVAINTKLIKDTFATLNEGDINKKMLLILFINIIISVLILILLYKTSGITLS